MDSYGASIPRAAYTLLPCFWSTKSWIFLLHQVDQSFQCPELNKLRINILLVYGIWLQSQLRRPRHLCSCAHCAETQFPSTVKGCGVPFLKLFLRATLASPSGPHNQSHLSFNAQMPDMTAVLEATTFLSNRSRQDGRHQCS